MHDIASSLNPFATIHSSIHPSIHVINPFTTFNSKTVECTADHSHHGPNHRRISSTPPTPGFKSNSAEAVHHANIVLAAAAASSPSSMQPGQESSIRISHHGNSEMDHHSAFSGYQDSVNGYQVSVLGPVSLASDGHTETSGMRRFPTPLAGAPQTRVSKYTAKRLTRYRAITRALDKVLMDFELHGLHTPGWISTLFVHPCL
jgi:hypothetical protein